MEFPAFLRFVALCLCLLPGISGAQETILVFGDSLSAGYGLPRESAWATLLQNELQRTHPQQYQVVNASISGETSSGGLTRIKPALARHKPVIVILELGANDGLRGSPLRYAKINLSRIIKSCQSAHARVLLVGMRLPPNYGEPYSTQFHQMFHELARQYHTALVPFMLAGVAPDQFQADNLHPTAAAQNIILRNILQFLEPMLKQVQVSHGQSTDTRNQPLSAAACRQPGGLARLESGSTAPGA